jgi:hypothetical protein
LIQRLSVFLRISEERLTAAAAQLKTGLRCVMMNAVIDAGTTSMEKDCAAY